MPSGIASNNKSIYEGVVSVVLSKNHQLKLNNGKKSRYNTVTVLVLTLRGYDDGKNS